MEGGIRAATRDDVDTIAAVLALAFLDDPFWAWLIPSSAERGRRLRHWFTLYTKRICLPHSECYVTTSSSGAALWLPPGAADPRLHENLILLPLKYIAMGRHLRSLMRAFHNFDLHKPTFPHFYLSLLGVAPESRGLGQGTALLRPVLGRCDADQVPAYLEATSERSRAFYERLGFEVREQFLNPPPDGPTAWGMLRNPPGLRRQ